MTQPTRSRFNLNRAQVVDENFLAYVNGQATSVSPVNNSAPVSPWLHCSLSGTDFIELFESQMTSRLIDFVAREMRARNEGFYTIGSSGHEGNAMVGRLTRHTDLAFLHYRAGAFMAERSRKVASIDFVRDTMLSLTASSEDPIAGGRHKVWGSLALNVPPQTSTIASHLPKAVGAAMMLARKLQLGLTPDRPTDEIIVCSFGDASSNHATAQTAFNAAARAAHQQLPVPILFVCEDNGIGISVKTPARWIEQQFSVRRGLTYFQADGLDLISGYDVVQRAVTHCRTHREPVFLHLKTVRLLGHAGSDPETQYHSFEQIEAVERQDPLLRSAQIAIEHGLLSPQKIIERYEAIRTRVREAAVHASTTPKLTTAAEIMAPMAPDTSDAVACEAARTSDLQVRSDFWSRDQDELPEHRPPRHLAALLNHGLQDLLLKYPEAIIFGEDVAKKGGVYHVTAGLSKKFGLGRVFNTILDETTILGLGIGAAQLGMLPIPEIQYLAYYHNAEDQIRGEASSLQFFSNGQFRNPMVVRMAGWAYQKGFGGHFHNDNSIAALRDVPGLVIASPARGDDAVEMLRTCLAMAKVDGRVVVFIEPIARYMTKDLYEPKDQAWSFPYPPPDRFIPQGLGKVYHESATDLTILTFANGVYMSLRAAKTLKEAHGINARVVDLRWLSPLNESFIVEQASSAGNVLVVDEGRRAGGISESILALLYENCGSKVTAARLNALDSFIPLGPAADCVLPTEADVVDSVVALLRKK